MIIFALFIRQNTQDRLQYGDVLFLRILYVVADTFHCNPNLPISGHIMDGHKSGHGQK